MSGKWSTSQAPLKMKTGVGGLESGLKCVRAVASGRWDRPREGSSSAALETSSSCGKPTFHIKHVTQSTLSTSLQRSKPLQNEAFIKRFFI